MSGFEVREASESDRDAIREVVAAAFAAAPGGGRAELELVERIWDSRARLPEIELVAVEGGRVVGHAMHSRATIGGEPVVALAPLAVAPPFQGRGAGSTLVRDALRRADAAGEALVGLLGHPGYYSRLGFVPGRTMHARPVDPDSLRHPDAFMLRPLAAYDEGRHRGVFRYFWEADADAGERIRHAVRALVVDLAGHVLLGRYDWRGRAIWVPPGGGVEAGESHEDALRRELVEEIGLRDVELGPCVWTRRVMFAMNDFFDGQSERYHLVRTQRFEPQPAMTWDELRAEGLLELRWWSPEELAACSDEVRPTRLASLLPELVSDGAPRVPVDVGY